MTTSRAKTTTSVCTSRRTVKSGISPPGPWRSRRSTVSSSGSTASLPFATRSSDTPGTLPARDSLQALKRPVDPEDEGLGERLAAPDRGDQEGAGDQVGHVVLAQIDQREAEGAGVAPTEGALGAARFRK